MAEREVVEQGMMGREKGRRGSLLPSLSPYPSHLALPFLVPISPCALFLLYEDDWGRVRVSTLGIASALINKRFLDGTWSG